MSLLTLLLAGCLLADEISAWELYEQGREAEKAGHMSEAYLLYSEPPPKNPTTRLTGSAVRPSGSARRWRPGRGPPPHPGRSRNGNGAPPRIPLDTARHRSCAAAREALPPTIWRWKPGVKDLDFQGGFKDALRSRGPCLRLEVIFIRLPPMDGLRVRLKAVDYRDALHGLEAATGSFIVPLSDKLFLVAKDTPQKRTEVEPTATIAVTIPDTLAQQDFQEIIRDVQQAMAIEKVSWDASSNTVVMRDRVSKLRPARALLEELLYPRAQVSMEMRFLEVTRNDMITYGVDFPSMFSLTPLTTAFNDAVSLPTGISGLLAFGGGKALMGIGIVNSALVAQLSKSTHIPAQIRTPFGKWSKASLHVGDRYPVVKSGYSAATSETDIWRHSGP